MSRSQVLEAPSIEGAWFGTSEEQLIRASLEGDVAAFARVYERYRRDLYGVCLSQLRDPARAEDIVQEVFLRAFTSLSRFDLGRPIWPWLVTMARRQCIDVHRRDRRVSLVGEPADQAEAHLGRATNDATLDAVVDGERREKLQRAIANLPARQRRALLLYALEGWSYPDIASAEGTSLVSIKSLIWRARATLRKVCEAGAFGFLLVPWRALNERLRGPAVRAREATSRTSLDTLLVGHGQTIVAYLAAMMIVVTSSAPTTTTRDGLTPRTTEHIAAPAHAERDGSSPANARPTRNGGAPARADRALSPADTAAGIHREVFDPTQGATPEKTRFTSIVASPGFARDRTIFAAGTISCQRERACRVLFESRDGGATWTKLSAQSFLGTTLILPPSYPADGRIFAMGPGGLEESTDHGRSFHLVNPLVGGVSISPRFESDPRILIGGNAVVEYWADRKLMKPAPLGVVSSTFSNPVFSPSYPGDETIVVGALSRTSPDDWSPIVHRCSGSICTSFAMPGIRSVPAIRLSPDFARDGLALALADGALFASRDGARSFRRVELPQGAITDLARIVQGVASPTLVASVRPKPGETRTSAVYVSADEGRSWLARPVEIAGFESGSVTVAVTQTGRLFAAGSLTGLACSDDSGIHWASHCAS